MHWIYWPLIVSTSAVIASFLNVVIYRGPTMWGLVGEDRTARGTLLGPGSNCPHCKKQIRPWCLVPIISFLFQRGKCAECRAPISLRYPIVEGLGVAIAVAAVILYGLTLTALLLAVYGWVLIVLAAIDWETGFLPDWLTLPLLALGLIANTGGLFVSIENAILGAVIGYLVFSLIGFAFKKLRGVEGLGQGDAKLLAALGAWAGALALPMVVFLSASLTLLTIGIAKLSGRDINAETQIPFGPALCLGGFVALLITVQCCPLISTTL